MTRRLRPEAGGDPTLGPVTELANSRPDTDDRLAGAPTPWGNRPGRHPAKEQDTPPLDEFAARLGLRDEPDAPPAGTDHERPRTPGRSGPHALLGHGVHDVRRMLAVALRAGGRASGAAADALNELSERVAPQDR
jgi:hypothetical protein